MADLIDRQAVIDLIKKNTTRDIEDIVITNNHIKLIADMPKAYDVSKVIAQLEEEREYAYADFEEYVNEKSPCLDAEYDDYFHRGLERAMRIVKAGGVE